VTQPLRGCVVAEQQQSELVKAGIVTADECRLGACRKLAHDLQQPPGIGEIQLAFELQSRRCDGRCGGGELLDGFLGASRRRAHNEIERLPVEDFCDAARDPGESGNPARRQSPLVIAAARSRWMSHGLGVAHDEEAVHPHSVAFRWPFR